MSASSDLPGPRFFLVSPTLASRKELETRIRAIPPAEQREWFSTLVESREYGEYLSQGEIPRCGLDRSWQSVKEPARSFLAALALFGTEVPRSSAIAFLEHLGFAGELGELMVPGLVAAGDDAIRFVSDAVAQTASEHIPAASRGSLCSIGAQIAEVRGDLALASRLLIQAGEWTDAVRLLEGLDMPSAEETVRTLRLIPLPRLTAALRSSLVRALFDLGRYRQAREVARAMDADERELVLAELDRRSGEYALALSRIDRLTESTSRSELLRADLLLLENRHEEAEAALSRVVPEGREEAIRGAYLRGLLALETRRAFVALEGIPGDHYYFSRLATYEALSVGRLTEAAVAAQQSLDRARTVPERIDAALDGLYIRFSSGVWREAREEALRMLTLVEETEGDRAAGGVLFLLAYLAADDGQWAHAAQRIHRLELFYREANDPRRLAEIELLHAHLHFSRGSFLTAARSASSILRQGVTGQIAEAAALILDEIDWIERRTNPLRSTGTSGNVELTDRHRLLCARRGLPHDPIVSPFLAALAAGDAVAPADGSEQLKCFRDALGRGSGELAQAIADRMGLETPAIAENGGARELRILRDAATAAFPFAPDLFGQLPWRFASRNRLGQWNESGSLPSMPAGELDAILAGERQDWVRCADQQLLFIEGLSSWSPEARETVSSLFALRADLHRMRRLALQEGEPREPVPEVLEGMIGDSPAMREVFATVARVCRREVPICILGESGTGKELVARAIHRQSARRSKPFTPVNCAALPENLIESELFGHVRGAFTGAERDRPGLIETTDGGTLFLDEIGEMPLLAQAKLLRFLQEGEFRRVGDPANRTADVRVVSATNRKLDGSVEQGRFREDLYYRVSGVEITLPPLRERTGDILMLAAHFVRREHDKHRSGPSALSPDAEAIFRSYRWPGNVRELQNTIRGAHALAGDAGLIDVQHLPARMQGIATSRAGGGSYQDAVMRFRRELIEKSLLQAEGNQNRAAALLKMSRQALAYQIRELGIMVRPGRGPVTDS